MKVNRILKTINVFSELLRHFIMLNMGSLGIGKPYYHEESEFDGTKGF